MGCIQSTSSRPRSPIPHQQEPEVETIRAPQQPSDEEDTGIILVSKSLRNVLRETKVLKDQIRADREKFGESLAGVDKSVTTLISRIRAKLNGNVLEGSGADDYRVLLNTISQEYAAVMAKEIAARESDHPPAFGSVFEFGSTSEPR